MLIGGLPNHQREAWGDRRTDRRTRRLQKRVDVSLCADNSPSFLLSPCDSTCHVCVDVPSFRRVETVPFQPVLRSVAPPRYQNLQSSEPTRAYVKAGGDKRGETAAGLKSPCPPGVTYACSCSFLWTPSRANRIRTGSKEIGEMSDEERRERERRCWLFFEVLIYTSLSLFLKFREREIRRREGGGAIRVIYSCYLNKETREERRKSSELRTPNLTHFLRSAARLRLCHSSSPAERGERRARRMFHAH